MKGIWRQLSDATKRTALRVSQARAYAAPSYSLHSEGVSPIETQRKLYARRMREEFDQQLRSSNLTPKSTYREWLTTRFRAPRGPLDSFLAHQILIHINTNPEHSIMAFEELMRLLVPGAAIPCPPNLSTLRESLEPLRDVFADTLPWFEGSETWDAADFAWPAERVGLGEQQAKLLAALVYSSPKGGWGAFCMKQALALNDNADKAPLFRLAYGQSLLWQHRWHAAEEALRGLEDRVGKVYLALALAKQRKWDEAGRALPPTKDGLPSEVAKLHAEITHRVTSEGVPLVPLQNIPKAVPLWIDAEELVSLPLVKEATRYKGGATLDYALRVLRSFAEKHPAMESRSVKVFNFTGADVGGVVTTSPVPLADELNRTSDVCVVSFSPVIASRAKFALRPKILSRLMKNYCVGVLSLRPGNVDHVPPADHSALQWQPPRPSDDELQIKQLYRTKRKAETALGKDYFRAREEERTQQSR